jgi:lysophospholipase L1-like esterase
MANVLDTLIIDGSNFRVGNGVQFRWTVGPGAGLWTESNYPPHIDSASRITVNMNPGSVADTISVRVCRFIGATSAQDCSSIYAVTVTPQTAAPPRWVALGDSYSSGEGAGTYAADSNYQICSVPPSDDSTCPMLVENRCHRSSRAYSQVVGPGLGFPDLRAEVFHACSGAETGNVLPRAAGGFFAQPNADPDNIPQLDQPDAGGENVDMVTLTIGGNDAKFVDILKTCLFNGAALNCADSNYEGFSPPTWREFMPNWIRVNVRDQIRKTLRQVCARSPKATIYLLGYPKLFPTESHFCFFYLGSLTAAEQTWLNGIAVELNSMLKEEAELSHVQFVDVEQYGTFHGHELCGAGDEFFNGIILSDSRESFHPNQSGQRDGYRKALITYLADHPPHKEGVPACDSTPFGSAELASNGDDASLAALAGDTATLGSIQVASPLLCQRNGLAFDRQVSARTDGFAAGSPVSFQLLSPAGVTDLGSATADANGLVQAEFALPQPAAISELAVLEANGTGSNGLFRKALGSFAIGPAASTDGDFDGTSDACDNCPELWNADQADADGDGIGDACDICPLASGNDSDGDGLCDNSDSCPYDSENDADGDGLCGNGADNCPVTYNPGQEDADGDLVGDACDDCPMIPNLGQEDVCPVAAPLDFYTLLPCRAVDTRLSQSPLLSGTGPRPFLMHGVCGIPATARTLSVNVTVVNPTQSGFVNLFAADRDAPGTSVANFRASQTRANNAIVPLSADGRLGAVAAFGAAGQVDLVVDVNGYFAEAEQGTITRYLAQNAPGAVGKDIWTTSVYSYAPGGGGPGGGLDDDGLRVGGWGDIYHSLLQFDLAGLPQNAASVRLELFCFGSGQGTPTQLYLDRITAPWDWRIQGTGSDRERLWWADRPNASLWSTGALPAPQVGQWYSIDITDLYNAWQAGTYPNYGVQLRPVSTDNKWAHFYSANYTADPLLRPRLVIEEGSATHPAE